MFSIFPCSWRNGIAIGMRLRSEIEKRIEKKEDEIWQLELRVREEKAYLQALQDTIKLIPREDRSDPGALLREGSQLAMAREAIMAAGTPLHADDLLKALGKPINKQARAALVGSLANYVRRGEVFTRPSPNTFGLRELGAVIPDPGSPIEKAAISNPFAVLDDPTEADQPSDDEIPF
ncbi:MAG: hypothetical protein ACRERC_23090 [Candidatus Binatia bacterium]